MQGSSRSLALRIRVTAAFAAAFLAGAVAVFAAASLLGSALRLSALPAAWRLGAAAALLVALAAVDVRAARRGTYSPLGWRRQAERRLMNRHRAEVVAAVWGFDTGLAVTTFRVAALTWGALALALLGLAPWWIGVGYGLGFAAPLGVLLWTHRVGRAAVAETPVDPGLDALLGRRTLAQLGSAVLLTAAGAAILVGLLA